MEKEVSSLKRCVKAQTTRETIEALTRVSEKLGALDQDEDRPDGLGQLCSMFVTESFTDHKSSTVRLWTACCICDVLRIYAPEAPYTTSELLVAFELVAAQLRRLGSEVPSDALTDRCSYILDSLREFQSSCALVALYQQGVESSVPALVEFADAVVYSAREEGSASTREAAAEVLATILGECEPIPNELMERLLLGLLPAQRKLNAAAHGVVQAAMRERQEILSRPVAAYLRGALSLTGGDNDDEDEDLPWRTNMASEVSSVKNVYALVYELHLVDPRMLLYVLPLATERLRCEEVSTRERVATLLARLFASPTYDYAGQYVEHYKEWLKRFGDKEASLRSRMVSLALRVVQERPSLRRELLAKCADRVADAVVEVRQEAVRLCCDAMLLAEIVDDDWAPVIKQLEERVKDKKADIRKESLTGLVQNFRAHVSDKWIVEEAAPRSTSAAWDVGEEEAEKRRPFSSQDELIDTSLALCSVSSAARLLGNVPRLCLRSFAASCNIGPVRERARLLLEERLLFGAHTSATGRAAALLGALMPTISGDEEDATSGRKALELLLKSQASAQMDVEVFLEKNDFTRVAKLVPQMTQGKTTLPRELAKHKDRHVQRALALAADCSAERPKRMEARLDLGRRLRSTSSKKKDEAHHLAEFATGCAMRCADVLVDAHSLKAALVMGADRLNNLEEDISEEDELIVEGCVSLLEVVTAAHPRLLAARSVATLARYATAAATARQTTSFVQGARALAAASHRTKDRGDSSLAVLRSVATADMDDEVEFLTECSKEAVGALAALVTDEKGARGLVKAVLGLDEDWSFGAGPLLVARLRGLCRLAMDLGPKVVAFDGARHLLETIDAALIRGRPTVPCSDEDESSDYDSSSFLALRAALKLPAYLTIGLLHHTGKEAWVGRLKDRAVEVCFNVLESNGVGGGAMSEKQTDDLRLTAASTAVKLATRGGVRLSVDQWRDVGFVALAPRLRLAFLRKLSRALHTGETKVVSRWASVLCLAALDHKQDTTSRRKKEPKKKKKKYDGESSEEETTKKKQKKTKKNDEEDVEEAKRELLLVRKEASEALRKAVERARAHHHKAAAASQDDEEDAAQRARLHRELPEYALPYAVHLLAHRPRHDDETGALMFSASAHDAQTQKALLALLDPLVASLGNGADNVAFLLALCSEMAGCDDAYDASKTAETRAVASTAGELIKKHYLKTTDSLRTTHPSEIFLPSALFCPPRDAEAAALRAHDAELLAYDRVSEANLRRPSAMRAPSATKPRAPPSTAKKSSAKKKKATPSPASQEEVLKAAKKSGVRVLPPTALAFEDEDDDEEESPLKENKKANKKANNKKQASPKKKAPPKKKRKSEDSAASPPTPPQRASSRRGATRAPKYVAPDSDDEEEEDDFEAVVSSRKKKTKAR